MIRTVDLTPDLIRTINSVPVGVEVVSMRRSDFSWICPVTGKPDYGTVTIEYKPENELLENISVDHFLDQFHHTTVYQEDLCSMITTELIRAISPEWITVTIAETPGQGLVHSVTCRWFSKAPLRKV
jgi:7-cyano-7-deazaguanine reductase